MEQARATRPRLGRTCGVLLALLVVLVSCGRTGSVAPAASSTPPAASGSQSPSASPSVALGRTLGRLSLGMRSSDVLAAVGEPMLRTQSHGLGSPEWHYADGLIVFLRFPTSPQQPDQVWQLTARSPFTGDTSEGFRLGDSTGVFRQRYAAFSVKTPVPEQFQVEDGRGTILGAIFDADRATTIIVEGR